MLLFTLLIGGIAGVLLLPAASDAASLIRAGLGRRAPRPAPYRSQRLLVLIPAHDEELLIEACVNSLAAQRFPAARYSIVVIADNCTDATASVARAAGARCLERSDPVNAGKPRALAWALSELDYREYDAVLIVDADAVVEPDFLAGLAEVPNLRGAAAQAFNGVVNPEDSALTRMAAVFAEARYSYQFPLKEAAGLNVPLMGNGMCIGTDVIAERGWTAFSICEDWELYGQLTERGVRIQGAPRARVYSQEARSLRQSASQRRRWAAGKITVLFRLAGPLLRSRSISAHQKLDALAELLTVGPAVHLGMTGVLVAGVQLLSIPGAPVLTALLLASVARLAIYTGVAVRRVEHPGQALAAFLFLPFYAVWRCFLQISALKMLGDRPWVRTERHG